MRFPRLGLRAQIVFALSSVFALSFWLAGYTVLQLSRKSAVLGEERAGRVLVRALAGELDQRGELSDARIAQLCAALADRLPGVGLRVSRADRTSYECGDHAGDARAVTALHGGGKLQLWMTRGRERSALPLAPLLMFYLALTGLAVLLLAYVALTYLIVRPLDRLTQSAEALPGGNELSFASPGGSAETARLAQAFNEMATQLRSERKRLVDRLAELERTTTELKNAEQQLIHGEKLASIGRLAAGIAHEIGNPLAAILGLVELMRGGGISESESREFLSRIQRETERIHGIIRDLLDFARRDIDEDAALHTSDLRDVIEDAVSLVRPQKESRDVVIDIAIDPATRRVIGPQHRLTQVTLNLLLNAVDALQGRGKIEVRVAPSADGKHAILRVDDDGPGIPEEMLGRLFDPFTTTKAAGKGTGLGLAVTHAILERLGGTITGENREPRGARFEVRLLQAALPPAGSTPV